MADLPEREIRPLAKSSAPAPKSSAPVTVQTKAAQSNASPGESGATIQASAMITVLVTDGAGAPVTNVGGPPSTAIGDGTSEINLPNGISMGVLVVPPGGSLVSVTQFINENNGLYVIRVVPWLQNPACQWLAGDYHYFVQIEQLAADGTSTLRGSALGVLTIK